MWYIYTMEYYSAVKKNSFESVLMRWVKLEPIIQSEVSQKEITFAFDLTMLFKICISTEFLLPSEFLSLLSSVVCQDRRKATCALSKWKYCHVVKAIGS